MNSVSKVLIATLSVAAGTLWLNMAHAASFDCAKARTRVEKMICANKDLSDWDSLMAQRYHLDMMWKRQIKWVRRTQLRWLNLRNKCQDVACLKKAYLDRIYELDNPPGNEGKWVNDPYNPGLKQHSPLCRALLKRLNSFTWKSGNCSWNVIGTFKGFSQPPWHELDPNKHLILIYKLLVSDGSVHGLKYYYNGKPRKPVSVEAERKRARQFIKRGGELLVWHARIFEYFRDQSHPAPPGKQTIVELRISTNDPLGVSQCRGKPELLWKARTYLVTPDLSGPDPRIRSPFANALSSGVLLIYDGGLYLYGPTGILTRLDMPGYRILGIPPSYCGFRYKEFKKENKQ